MAQGGGELIGAVEVDYSGIRYALGRTTDAYAIWERTGGPPTRTFPLTDEGWVDAWTAYQGLEGEAGAPVGPAQPSAGAEPPAAGQPSGGWGAPAVGPSVMDHPGGRYGLGRAQGQYVIWDLQAGTVERTFPLTDEGWAQAWPAFEELDAPYRFVPTSQWQKGRPIPIRAMRAGQIIGGAFKLYFMHFWKLLALVAVVLIPLYAITGALTVTTLERVTVTNAFGSVESFRNPLWVTVVNAVLQLLAFPFLTAAVLGAIAEAFLGREVTLGRAYRLAFRRALAVLWVTILTTLASALFVIPAFVVLVISILAGSRGLLGLYALLLVAGLIAAMFVVVRLLFATSTVVVEGKRGVAALRRSWDLVRGLGWKVIGNLLLMGLIVFGIALVIFLVAGIILGIVFLGDAFQGATTGGVDVGDFRGLLISFSILSAFVGIMLVPLTNVTIVLLYFDARVRKERFDERELARELDAARAAAQGSPFSQAPPR